MLLAFAQDWFEDYVMASEDIETGLGLRVLGVLPRIEGSPSRNDIALSTANRENLKFAEAIAGVRATIFGGSDEPPKTILISSAGVQCGKTVVSCNLASILARCDQQTLLVDLDMRRPRVARMFSIKIDRKHSLSHALSRNDRDFAPLVNTTKVENLFVLGSLSDSKLSPAEIVGGSAMLAFLEWAKSNYDRVIIDSPPHGLMSDALALASHVDGVLLVSRHEKSRKRAIRHAIRQIGEVGVNMLGMVVNAAPMGGDMFSKYDYYHGSYDHNEYVPTKAKEES
jgi:succinoglycan biosynthesis transport protein ExoP